MLVLDLGESPSGKFPAEISSYVLDFSEKYLDQRRVKGKGQLALAGTKTNNTIKQQRRYEHYKVKEKEFILFIFFFFRKKNLETTKIK